MDNFRDYIWYLLPAVLKRHKSINQFYIFCKISGSIFDDLKAKMFQLREETILDTCSNSLLEVAGQDRNMIRMKGESFEAFRKRLKMKALIAQMAGTKQGILYSLKSVGYDNCNIYPLYMDATDKWAEININFYADSVDEENKIDFKCIVDSVMQTKKASTLPHYVFFYPTIIRSQETIEDSLIINRFSSTFFECALYLDGSWVLDGSQLLDGNMTSLNAATCIRFENVNTETIEINLRTENDLWYLDGSAILNGSRKLDAYIKEEKL